MQSFNGKLDSNRATFLMKILYLEYRDKQRIPIILVIALLSFIIEKFPFYMPVLFIRCFCRYAKMGRTKREGYSISE